MSEREQFKIHVGDCLEVMRGLPDSSVDAIVTDPPYGLNFMGKKWDYDVPSVEIWHECLRVLKPGGHLLAFAGTRTQHRMAVRIEDAGFEIRDMIAWVYASGFPKSRDLTDPMRRWMAGERFAGLGINPKVINPDVYTVTAFLREARDRAGWSNKRIDELFSTNGMAGHWTSSGTQPAIPSVRQWNVLKKAIGFGDEMDSIVSRLAATERPDDWGNGQSNANERFLDTMPRQLGRTQSWGSALKPAIEPITIARKHLAGTLSANVLTHGTGALNIDGCRVETSDDCARKPSLVHNTAAGFGKGVAMGGLGHDAGRWPANLIHDGGEECVDLLKDAARFFYCAKASKRDRDEGCDGLEEKLAMRYGEKNQGPLPQQTPSKPVAQRNHHPTVKPTDLMRYLCRLVTPPGGLVLDPFTGSGSTGRGAILEGFRFLGIERDPEYAKIAEARITASVTKRESNKGLFD